MTLAGRWLIGMMLSLLVALLVETLGGPTWAAFGFAAVIWTMILYSDGSNG